MDFFGSQVLSAFSAAICIGIYAIRMARGAGHGVARHYFSVIKPFSSSNVFLSLLFFMFMALAAWTVSTAKRHKIKIAGKANNTCFIFIFPPLW